VFAVLAARAARSRSSLHACSRPHPCHSPPSPHLLVLGNGTPDENDEALRSVLVPAVLQSEHGDGEGRAEVHGGGVGELGVKGGLEKGG